MNGSTSSLRSVRKGEEFDMRAIQDYLAAFVPNLTDPITVQQFSAGHSNLTYLLTSGEWEGVLRRPPLGPVAKKAHDMGREARFLQALYPLFPLAPKPLVYCEDTNLIGSPFFVMERKRGVVVDKTWPDEFVPSPEVYGKLSEAFIDTLVALHAVEYRGTDLEAIGHPEGYMQRQVEGWIERYQRAKTDDSAEAEAIAKWLISHIPVSPPATVVHNDFKLNNMLIASRDPGCVTAVLDWEMATLGDPLSDLAIALSYWADKEDPPSFRLGLSDITTRPGFYTRNDLIEAYSKKSGRDVEAMDFYLSFAYFKVAVICQQIYYRWKCGQTQDDRFAAMGQVAQSLIQLAFATSKS